MWLSALKAQNTPPMSAAWAPRDEPHFSFNPTAGRCTQLIDSARQRVASTVNAELTQLYWQIGSRVNAELLKGQRAEYGKQVVVELAQQLTTEFGKGWSERQLRYCLRIAEVFPDAQILHTLCSQLSWSHLNCDLKKTRRNHSTRPHATPYPRPARRGNTHWPHPLYRKKPGTRRTAATAAKQNHPRPGQHQPSAGRRPVYGQH